MTGTRCRSSSAGRNRWSPNLWYCSGSQAVPLGRGAPGLARRVHRPHPPHRPRTLPGRRASAAERLRVPRSLEHHVERAAPAVLAARLAPGGDQFGLPAGEPFGDPRRQHRPALGGVISLAVDHHHETVSRQPPRPQEALQQLARFLLGLLAQRDRGVVAHPPLAALEFPEQGGRRREAGSRGRQVPDGAEEFRRRLGDRLSELGRGPARSVGEPRAS